MYLQLSLCVALIEAAPTSVRYMQQYSMLHRLPFPKLTTCRKGGYSIPDWIHQGQMTVNDTGITTGQVGVISVSFVTNPLHRVMCTNPHLPMDTPVFA